LEVPHHSLSKTSPLSLALSILTPGPSSFLSSPPAPHPFYPHPLPLSFPRRGVPGKIESDFLSTYQLAGTTLKFYLFQPRRGDSYGRNWMATSIPSPLLEKERGARQGGVRL